MKNTNLRITKSAWDAVRKHLLRNDCCEHLAFLPLGIQATPEGAELLAFECWPVDDCELVHGACKDYLELSGPAYLKVLNRAIRLGVGLLEIHNHPGTSHPFFSWADNAGLAQVVPHMLESLSVPHYASLVINDNAEFVGKHWLDSVGNSIPIVAMEVLEQKRICLKSVEAPPTGLRLCCAMFDRQIRAFGAEGQRALASLRVGLVGLGGLGSVAAVQLAHIGVCDFVLVDPDRVEQTNLNRVLAATLHHVVEGEYKTRVAADYIKALNPTAKVNEISESVFSQKAMGALAQCDLVICGTDDSASRYAVNDLCLAYLRPYLDLGTQIDVKDGVIDNIGGRYTFAIPGLGCLLCSQAIDPHDAAKEFQLPELVQHDRQRGYITGHQEPAPSVLPLNSTIVSLALNEVLAWVTGWRIPQQQVFYDGRSGLTNPVRFAANKICMACSESLGRGDQSGILQKYAKYARPTLKVAS